MCTHGTPLHWDELQLKRQPAQLTCNKRNKLVTPTNTDIHLNNKGGVICSQAATVSTTAMKHQYWVQHE
jgi:hypothetical protein